MFVVIFLQIFIFLFSAFKTLPGVDSSLFTEEWLANQYRWIVWKLASMERSFPETFAGRYVKIEEIDLVVIHTNYFYDSFRI